LVEFETPEGYVAIGPETYREEPETRTAYAEREVITIEAQNLAAAQTAQERLQIIADLPGAQVALETLNALLGLVGLSIPVSEAAASGHILTMMAQGHIAPDSGIAGNIQGAWQMVLAYMTRDEVPEVWWILHPELKPETEVGDEN
jgi:hypothetical protein